MANSRLDLTKYPIYKHPKTQWVVHIPTLCVLLLLMSMSVALSAKTTLTIEFEGNKSQRKQGEVTSWLNDALSHTQEALGPLKQKELTVALSFDYLTQELVPWGEVKRGETLNDNQIHLTLCGYCRVPEMRRDWTVYHELAHLYIPKLDPAHAWLNEGFATFMQYRIMKNAGVISPGYYFGAIKGGFQRGRIDTRKHPGPLNAVSKTYWQTGAHKRIYWTGAAFYFELDAYLKQKGMHVEDVIKAYQKEHNENALNGRDFIQTLAKISGEAEVINLYLRYHSRADFPDISVL